MNSEFICQIVATLLQLFFAQKSLVPGRMPLPHCLAVRRIWNYLTVPSDLSVRLKKRHDRTLREF